METVLSTDFCLPTTVFNRHSLVLCSTFISYTMWCCHSKLDLLGYRLLQGYASQRLVSLGGDFSKVEA